VAVVVAPGPAFVHPGSGPGSGPAVAAVVAAAEAGSGHKQDYIWPPYHRDYSSKNVYKLRCLMAGLCHLSQHCQ